MKIVIRSERKEDFDKITEINDQAFGLPDEGNLIINLRKTRDFNAHLSLVAVDADNDKTMGHILFYPIKIKSGDTEYQSLSLAPMSVLPEFQRKMIGSKMVTEGLIREKNLGYKSVIVLGHVNFYPRFGFQPASKWGINCPFDVPNEAFMTLELVENGLHKTEGVVVYPKEFDDV